jgi:hypothetical protein
MRLVVRDSQPANLDVLALRLFGRTKAQAHAHKVCLRCGEPPLMRNASDEREWAISGLCHDCFDVITGTW